MLLLYRFIFLCFSCVFYFYCLCTIFVFVCLCFVCFCSSFS